MTFAQERLQRDDSTGLRSVQNNKFSGRKSAEWRVNKYIIPSGVAGTEPDDGELWQALMGDVTIASATVTYSLDDDDLQTLTMYLFGGHFEQGLVGCGVQSATISLSGTDFSTVEFTGVAKDHIWAGVGELTTNIVSGAVAMVVKNRDLISTGAIVRIGSNTNSVTGFRVTAKTANSTITFTPACNTNQATGASVEPHNFTQTTAGTGLHGIAGSITLAGAAVTITGATVNIENGIEVRNDEYGSSSPTEIVYTGRRVVSGTLELFMPKSVFKYYGQMARFVETAVVLTAGDTAGLKMLITMTQTEFEIPAISVPEGSEGEVSMTVAFQALATSSGQNEITIAFI